MNDYDDVVSWAPILVILDTHEMGKNPLDGSGEVSWNNGSMFSGTDGAMQLCRF